MSSNCTNSKSFIPDPNSPVFTKEGSEISPITDGDDINLGTGGFKDDNTITEIELADALNPVLLTENKTSLVGAINELKNTLDVVSAALIFKGSIFLPEDFPTLIDVQVNWLYAIEADVTDNDVTKTNTGKSFVAGSQIAWNGTTWSITSAPIWKEDGTDVLPVSTGANINLDSGGLKDTNVTTAIKLGDSSNTSLATTNKTIVGSINELNTNFYNLDGNGVVSGIEISINTDTTKIDISSGVYHVITDVNKIFDGLTAVTLTNLATHNVTYLALDLDGNLVQQVTPFTMSQRRTHILIGVAVHSNRLNVNAVNNLPDVAVSSASQLNDLIDGLHSFNVDGNLFYANGANLYINKTVGYLFKKGVNFTTDNSNPHNILLPALEAPSNIRYRLSDGTEYADTQEISLFYESPLGTREALPTNRFSIQRITVFSSNLVRIQYGQAIYKTQAEALQAIYTEAFVTEANILANGQLRSFLIINGAVTELNNSDDAVFIPADRFGQLPSGSAGGTTSLQQAYNNSETPEIVTNSLLGAVSLKRGSDADTDLVFEVIDGSDNITASIAGNGNSKFGDITNGNYSEIETDGTYSAHGNALTWNDSMIPASTFRTGGTALAFAEFKGNIYMHRLDIGDIFYVQIQLPHNMAVNTMISPHLHLACNSAIETTNYNVEVTTEYSWANIGSAFPENVVVSSGQILSFQNSPQYTHKLLELADITPTTGQGGISSYVIFRVERIEASTQPISPANSVFILGMDIHYQIDTLGSRQEIVK